MNCGIISAARRRSAATGDPNFSNVVLLMGFEGTDNSTSFVDESASAHTMTAAGNAKITTSQFKMGSSCATFDGAGDYISTPNHADFAFGLGQFTVEGFFRFLSKTDNQTMIGYVNDNGSAVATAWLFMILGGQLLFRFYTPDGIGVLNCQASWVPTLGTWYHLAYDRDATTDGRLYVNGTMLTSAAGDHTIQTTAGHLVLGSLGFGDPAPGFDFNGQMDEVRITKGVARYGSDAGFTVPASAFPRS
jgi:hypothetical protein